MSRPTEADNKTLWELILAGGSTLLFLGLSALFLWPFGKAALAIHLAKGYVVFWIVLSFASWVLGLVHRMFRFESDPPSSPYVFTNLGLSAFLQVGWSAFAVLAVSGFLGGSSIWLAVGLHLAGFLSSLVASVMVGAFYQGTLYKFVNGPLALVSYIVFAVWPALGRAIYGWFLDLF
ncbi:MAG TPA: hypothetical protein VGW39_11870 [Chthoniobacterales bacterium]|nr:hypothetical protein [Chthoniobacterales bacterium]